jgi:glycosyltransferase involved in cell wall biosynthesis
VRVANIIEEGRWGGPQKRIVLVAKYIQALGIHTTVLCPTRDSFALCDALDELSIDYVSINIHRLSRRWNLLVYLATFPVDIFKIFLALRRGKYEILHVSGGAWQIKGPIAGWLAGVPVIWHLNDTQMPGTLVSLFRTFSSLAAAYIVAAERVRNFYFQRKCPPEFLVHHIPAPVSVSIMNRENYCEREPIFNDSALKIVTVANVTPVKGLELLADVSALLVKSDVPHSCHVIGSIHTNQHQYFDLLKSRVYRYGISERFTFHGYTQNVGVVLKAADIYVCSSVAEASPMSVWEAMSMECAVVSTDVGDVSKYIKNGYNGFVVPVGDVQAMADAIIKFANDTELRRLFGKRAREVACRELDINIIAEKTAEVYRSVLEREKLK